MSGRPFLDVAQGCTRLTLLVGPYAVKVPNLLRGWRDALWGLLHNMTEAELAAGPSRWAGLCPVLWRIPGGFLSVMPRLTPLTPEEFREHYWRLRHAHEERGVTFEPKPDSFAWRDGRVVAVDFAP